MATNTAHEIAKQIPNRFDFEHAQPRLFQLWENGGYFRAQVHRERKPYTIVIPPPNVTGALHLGHALNNTLQDILIRWRRMQGFETLWVPGTDHAGIATQAVVERRLKEEEGKTRHDLGRDQLVKRIWEWKDQYESRIIGQLKQMGCSCDWERTRFTLDERCARAVRQTFFDLFNQDLIYRGKRLVNWDTYLQTAISDDEVFNETVDGFFWHLKYPVIDSRPGEPEFVIVATTRPETMLGDTAVAVHPDPAKALDKVEQSLQAKLGSASVSERDAIEAELQALQHRRNSMLSSLEQLRDMALDGRMLNLPLLNRTIPLICDEWPKPELGSGCVKITPAHDPNDYEVGQRHKLEMINILHPDGRLNAEAGPYEGLSLKEARKRVVADLEALDLVLEVEPRKIELPHSDRSKTPIEPFLANQWFVKMEQLSQTAMDAVTDGRVKIFPPRYAKTYLDWLGEKRDWPVSRQLWWGHQIPVWSRPVQDEQEQRAVVRELTESLKINGTSASIQVEPCDEQDEAKRLRLNLPFATIHVAICRENDPLEKLVEAIGFTRVEDVLDTWFSSALWPHSTLGWPEKTEELAYFYPTSTLVTSRDIITLWVARMVLMGLNNCGEIPFSEVFIHPKILDGYGETMSKSKGNGIDPLDVIDKFGADALRFGMAYLTTETQDVRMPVQFECPHCEASIEQTHKNRELPRISCPKCNRDFATQWAKSEADLKLPRGLVLSERFEVARNFCNKLWNASRFSLMHFDGFTAKPTDDSELRLEDRWILSRLSTVQQQVTGELQHYRFAEAARTLYDFAWDDFCSFYIEILKDRFADESQRGVAQNLLAFTLDQVLRLLHPFIPFITEEIWQLLGKVAPQRGLEDLDHAEPVLIAAAWDQLGDEWQNKEIESQFAKFQNVLAGLREIRARQNIGPRNSVNFVVRCNDVDARRLQDMLPNFRSMAHAVCLAIGTNVEIPSPSATITMSDMEVFVDLTGLIDVKAEKLRLEKEQQRLVKLVESNRAKLANESFAQRAPEQVVAQVRDTLKEAEDQLDSLQRALNDLAKIKH
ncbi:MAG TPA: valine--tRNA ligase [Pirellulaceae bacterium]|nr:valine--tRNA ligase [Pirellulaceae bacterium]HMO93962.1 valine--tRNA ligase [Pirellulaceae bacterium]HMP67968.1 valine--tRNA ligase [Pirellulaceae bacterium]